MGRSKEMMMEHDENMAAAAGYLVRVDMLQQCPYHEDTIYGGGGMDLESDFWRNTMADRKRGDAGPIPWAAELESREFTDLIKGAYEEHCADECGWCAKHMAE